MKKAFFLILNIILISSCSNDDDSSSTINKITIDGINYKLNGGYIDPGHELDDDLNWKYGQDIVIFGGGIKFNPNTGYKGTGFVLFFKLHSTNYELDQGEYNFSNNNEPSSFNQCAFSTDFNVNNEDNEISGIIQSGSINITWTNKIHTITFDMIDQNGKNITGHFEHKMLSTK